jgi:hypothetical protein
MGWQWLTQRRVYREDDGWRAGYFTKGYDDKVGLNIGK